MACEESSWQKYELPTIRVELNPKTILIATADDHKNLCKTFTRKRRLGHCALRCSGGHKPPSAFIARLLPRPAAGYFPLELTVTVIVQRGRISLSRFPRYRGVCLSKVNLGYARLSTAIELTENKEEFS
jgi:hypothetical protein